MLPYSPLGISVERIGRRGGRHGGVKQRRNDYSLRTADGIERGENVVVNLAAAANATGSGSQVHLSVILASHSFDSSDLRKFDFYSLNNFKQQYYFYFRWTLLPPVYTANIFDWHFGFRLCKPTSSLNPTPVSTSTSDREVSSMFGQIIVETSPLTVFLQDRASLER
jgi:hypothetical protein